MCSRIAANPLRPFVFLALLSSASAALAEQERGCFTILAGRAATVDGSVLFGHNEDNGMDDPAGLRYVPRAGHPEGSWISLPGGGRLAQVAKTNAYFELAMPGCPNSDLLVNEHGVAIASNNCPSREDRPVLTDGGIGDPILRHLVAERASTAREGVELVGSVVERFGYTESGRTFTIADAREGWLLAMVNGKHWVAARVADDEVAMIANTFTIRAVDLTDTSRFRGSPDLVDHAKARGWYDPREGPFDFEKAYAGRPNRTNPVNTHRQWSGLRYIAAGQLPLPEAGALPFALKPRAPVSVMAIASALRDHYEGTPFAATSGSPHAGPISPICRPYTNSSSIFQLRPPLPATAGSVWWLCLWQPCSSPYVPIYCDGRSVPPPLGLGPPEGGKPTFGPAYRRFSDLARWVERDYAARAPRARSVWGRFEAASLALRQGSEEQALDLAQKLMAEPAPAPGEE